MHVIGILAIVLTAFVHAQFSIAAVTIAGQISAFCTQQLHNV